MINEPLFLIKGRAPGLQVYRPGDNPNGFIYSRIRGLTSVGSDASPLIVVDGMLGIGLASVDPQSIASVEVIRSGSLASIYGIRGANGIIQITTKSSKSNTLRATYSSGLSLSSISRKIPVFTASEYIAAGGTDLGNEIDWQDEVTRTSFTNTHHLFLTGGINNTKMSLSANFRDVDGILEHSTFQRGNLRFNLNQKALDDKLKINFSSSITQQNADHSFNEAFRYAILASPTMPVRFESGDFYQPILFDNFNPAAIIGLNKNLNKNHIFNMAGSLEYTTFPALTIGGMISTQAIKMISTTIMTDSRFLGGYNLLREDTTYLILLGDGIGIETKKISYSPQISIQNLRSSLVA